MLKKYTTPILAILIAVCMLTLLIGGMKEDERAYKTAACYAKSLELWKTVNTDYPYSMTSQESYEKNNRQACAAFTYAACMNGATVECASIKHDFPDQ